MKPSLLVVGVTQQSSVTLKKSTKINQYSTKVRPAICLSNVFIPVVKNFGRRYEPSPHPCR